MHIGSMRAYITQAKLQLLGGSFFSGTSVLFLPLGTCDQPILAGLQHVKSSHSLSRRRAVDLAAGAQRGLLIVIIAHRRQVTALSS